LDISGARTLAQLLQWHTAQTLGSPVQVTLTAPQ